MAEQKEPNLVRRIDRNTVVGDKAAILKIVMQDENKTHFLYRIGGCAVGAITGQSKFGEWTKLVGRFKAINADNEAFVSGTAFLPGDVSDIIAKRLENSQECVFLYDVYARFDKSLATSYGFIVEPVREATAQDPLDLLFEGAKPLALTDQTSK